MSTLALAPTLFDDPEGKRTLDDALVRVWEGVTDERAVACPVCRGEMRPEYEDRGRPAGARCTRCGSMLA